MRVLPSNRRTRVLLGLTLAALAALWWDGPRHKEARFAGRPAEWWAGRMRELEEQQAAARAGMPLWQAAELYMVRSRLAGGPVDAADAADPAMASLLLELLHHPDPDVRFRAACWLTWHGPEGERR